MKFFVCACFTITCFTITCFTMSCLLSSTLAFAMTVGKISQTEDVSVFIDTLQTCQEKISTEESSGNDGYVRNKFPVDMENIERRESDITFVERELFFDGLGSRVIRSLVVANTAAPPDTNDLLLKEIDGGSQFIMALLTALLNIPRMNSDGQDYAFLWQLIDSIPPGNQLELFFNIPGSDHTPVMFYQQHWVILADLAESGIFWFPDMAGSEWLPGARPVFPLEETVISYLARVVTVVNKLADQLPFDFQKLRCLEGGDKICLYQSRELWQPPALNERLFFMEQSRYLIPLAGRENMASLMVSLPDHRLELTMLHKQLEYMDLPLLYYHSCMECSERFDLSVMRRHGPLMNFAKLIHLLTVIDSPVIVQQRHPEHQMLNAGQGPGGGPGDDPLRSGGLEYISIQDAEIAAVQHGGRRGKSGKQSPPKAKGGGQYHDNHQSDNGASGNASSRGGGGGGGGGSGDGSSDREKESGKPRKIKKAIKAFFVEGFKEIIESANRLGRDLEEEREYLMRKRSGSMDDGSAESNHATPERNRHRLRHWPHVKKQGINGENTKRVAVDSLDDTVIYSPEVESGEGEEEYEVELDTKTLIAVQNRRASTAVNSDLRAHHTVPGDNSAEAMEDVVDKESADPFSDSTVKQMATGRRRVSSLAREDVDALGHRVDSILKDEKPIARMNKAELVAAREKINQMYSEELILRHDELTRLDQGRTRLGMEIAQKKEELATMYRAWYGQDSEQLAQANRALADLQLKAKGVQEEFAGMDGYDQRFQHWAESMIKEKFYTEATERTESLDQTQLKLVRTFKVAYVGRYWKGLAAHKTPPAMPPFRLAEPPTQKPELPLIQDANSYFPIKGDLLLGGISALLGSSMLVYYWDSIYGWATGKTSNTSTEASEGYESLE